MQSDQLPDVVFGLSCGTVRMFDMDLNGPPCVAHGKHGDEFSVFRTVEDRVDDVAGISAEHTAVVGHGFAVAESADHEVDHFGCLTAEKGVFAFFPDRADDIVSLPEFFNEFRDLLRRILEIRVKGDDVFAD